MRTLLLSIGAVCLVTGPTFAQPEAAPVEGATTSPRILLKYAEFDPLGSLPRVPDLLGAAVDTNLWIVQFGDRPTEADRLRLRQAGAEVHGYLPVNAYVVRMSQATSQEVSGSTAVRWVGPYQPAYRLEEALLATILSDGVLPAQKYNIVVVDKRADKPGLALKIAGIGGTVTHEQPGSILFEVFLNHVQLLQAARFDEVLWIDRWTAPEEDMNNVRIQGGGNYVEAMSGGKYTGTGVNGHVYEGCDATNVDFNSTAIAVQTSPVSSSHGHHTAGIICGNGTSHPDGRGMAPDIQLHYTNYSYVTPGWSRWQVIQDLVNTYEGMFTSASWGGGLTTVYTSTSAEADDIIFDHDIPWTQSQSNAGTTSSRPQAWAKNIFSIGAIRHFNNSNANDDSWQAGYGSTGYASDQRIKPDLCAYLDDILCSSSGGGYTTSFGGTSGATPIVGGHNALAIQMFTDGTTHGIFDNPLRVPGGTMFQNRPHFSTVKALQIANAKQYPFGPTSTDNRRNHCGWGFPDLQSMWDNRDSMFVVDEEDVLAQGETREYDIKVDVGQAELKVALCYPDPAGNPSSSIALINDLTLRVTAPDGKQYWGNNGLKAGNYSNIGGVANDRDTVECVFIANPLAGGWKVEVIATLIAQDAHVETPAVVDADFGLVVNGGTYIDPNTCPAPVPYGTGELCSKGTVANLGTLGLPYAGNPSFALALEGGNTVSSCVLFSGDNQANSAQIWGTILVGAPNFIRTWTTTNGQGKASVVLPILPAMVGTTRYFQYAVRDPGFGGNVQGSNGLVVTFCP